MISESVISQPGLMELFLCVKTSGEKTSETEKKDEETKEEVSGRHKASSQLLVTVGRSAIKPFQKLLGLASFPCLYSLQYLIAFSIWNMEGESLGDFIKYNGVRYV